MAANTSALVLRREFRSYFLSPIAYIVIGIFLIVTGWFFFSPFFLNNRADLRDFFSLLPLILSIVVPAITMRLFSDEYRTGTYEITRTLPLSLFSVVSGKFIAAVMFVALMLLPTVSYAIFVTSLGNLDWGPVVGGYAGALLLGATYCAIGIFASSLSKNQIVAYVIGIALCLFFTMIDRSLTLLPPSIAGVFQYLAADFHFQNIGKGVFDTRDLVYFLSLPAVALYATSLVLARPQIRGRSGLTLGLQLGAHASFLLIVIVVNAASGSLFARADLTQDRIHSLSQISRDTIASLREPVTVRAFFSRNLPAPYNNVEQSLRDLLGSYSLQNSSEFNFAFYSMTKPEESLNFSSDEELTENERLAREYGVFPIQIQQVEQDEMTLTNAYMGVVVIHGDTAETLGAVTSTDQLEYKLTTTIRTLTERTSTLLSMDSPIGVDLYLSSTLANIAPEFQQLPLVVDQIVRELNSEFYNKLSYRLVDPASDTAVRDTARELQLSSLRFRMEGAADDAESEAYSTVVLSVGEEIVRLNLLISTSSGSQLVDPETLKQGIQANLNGLLSSQLEVGYMVGNETPPYRGFSSARDSIIVVPDLVNFYPLVTKEYEIRAFFAKNGVPEGLRTVLVVGPREELTEYDLFQLDQFLMRGGSIIMFLDSYDIAIAGNQSMYNERHTGLEEMIEHYGLRLTRSFLMDEESYVVRETNPAGVAVEVPVYSAPLIGEDQMNTEFPFLRNIENMIMVSVTVVEPVEQLPPNVQAYPLVQSSEKAWVIEGDLNFNNPINASPPPESQRSQYGIAYLLEGQFESYFAGRPLPAPPSDDSDEDEESVGRLQPDLVAASQEFIPVSSGAQLILIGTTMATDKSLIDGAGFAPGAKFLLNTIDFMNGREGIAEMRSKGSRFRALDETTPLVRGFTKYFNIAGLPVIVIAIGLAVWLLYRGRRRRVQRQFAGKNDE